MSQHKRPRSGSCNSTSPDSITSRQPTLSDQHHLAKKPCYNQGSPQHYGARSAGQGSSTRPRHDLLRNHNYETINVDGNAQVQLGDTYHHYHGGSYVAGSFSVSGNMIVNNNCADHQHLPRSILGDHDVVALKRALYYESMEKRKAMLDQVDPATFDWIWSQTSFPNWLETGTGLYWICGKPGSGKSTLINYLLRDGSETVKSRLALNGTDPLLVDFFFDFRAGSAVANSPLGLLRSFLLQLIDRSHAVKHYLLEQCGYRFEGSWPEMEKELLDLICDSIQYEPRTVCGFIDGLDEYNGSLMSLAAFIILLQKRSGMKLCLASRPHAELKHKLGSASFEMQSHNNATIRAYADTALLNLEVEFSQRDLHDALTKIEFDAGGVILWARFAVDEIVCAVLHGESLSFALRKLDHFPRELGQIYERILRLLTVSQKMQAAVVFFVIEFWNSSWSAGGSLVLSPEFLMMLYSNILFKLGHQEHTEYTNDRDTHRFCRKVRSMLQGLVLFVEFTPDKFEPVLMHKTLKTFLCSSQEYSTLKQRIVDVVDPDTLAPMFMCQNIITADKSHGGNVIPYGYSEHAIKNFFYAHRVDRWNHPKIAPWYLTAIQTELWRQQNDFAMPNEFKFEEYPELDYLVYHGCYPAVFDLAIAQETYDLTEEERDSLREEHDRNAQAWEQ